jgi:hypothetical protein
MNAMIYCSIALLILIVYGTASVVHIERFSKRDRYGKVEEGLYGVFGVLSVIGALLWPLSILLITITLIIWAISREIINELAKKDVK